MLHLTATDLVIICGLYAIALAFVTWQARRPVASKQPARMHPATAPLLAITAIALLGVTVSAAVDPAAAAMLARLID